MTGNPDLHYFRLQLKEVPRCARRGLLRQFLLVTASSTALVGACLIFVWWMAG